MDLPRPRSTKAGKKKGSAESEYILRERSRSFIDAIERP